MGDGGGGDPDGRQRRRPRRMGSGGGGGPEGRQRRRPKGTTVVEDTQTDGRWWRRTPGRTVESEGRRRSDGMLGRPLLFVVKEPVRFSAWIVVKGPVQNNT
jgi:hypothetical protein